MTRIIAGVARGRRLQVPPKGTRPTASRARESLFSALESRGALEDSSVLDLYAGSGALGLEAISRGGAHASLVDSSRQAIKVAKANVRACNFGTEVTVKQSEASRFLREQVAAGTRYDLVFLDPPYDMPTEDLETVLAALTELVPEGGHVVIERPSSARKPMVDGYQNEYERKWGAASATILRKTASSDTSEAPSDTSEAPTNNI